MSDDLHVTDDTKAKTHGLHVVIMFEPLLPGEPRYSPSSEVNEVFGPFTTGDEADAWSERAKRLFKGRRFFCIIPLSDPNALNALDPEVN